MCRRRRLLFFSSFFSLAFWAGFGWCVTLLDVRIGNDLEKVRLVFDFDRKVAFQTLEDRRERQLMLLLKGVDVAKSFLKKKQLPGPYLEALSISSLSEKKKILAIEIQYRNFAPYTVFTLTDPFRLVVDVAKVFDQKEYVPVSAGVWALQWVKGTSLGPVRMEAGIVDLLRAEVDLVFDPGSLKKKKSVKKWAIEGGYLLAINGSFFSPDGTPLGLVQKGSQIYRESLFNRSALWVDPNHVQIKRASVEIIVEVGGKKFAVSGVNRSRAEAEVILYTRAFGSSTRTNQYGSEWIVRGGKIVSILFDQGNAAIPEDGFVLSFHKKHELIKATPGDEVSIFVKPSFDGWILQAGPTVLKGGKVAVTGRSEKFKADVLESRAPRSLVGFNGQMLYVLRIEGRKEMSIGATLSEAALYLRELGATEGINLDGGKSSQFYVKGVFEKEGIPVPNAIAVKPKENQGKVEKQGEAVF